MERCRTCWALTLYMLMYGLKGDGPGSVPSLESLSYWSVSARVGRQNERSRYRPGSCKRQSSLRERALPRRVSYNYFTCDIQDVIGPSRDGLGLPPHIKAPPSSSTCLVALPWLFSYTADEHSFQPHLRKKLLIPSPPTTHHQATWDVVLRGDHLTEATLLQTFEQEEEKEEREKKVRAPLGLAAVVAGVEEEKA